MSILDRLERVTDAAALVGVAVILPLIGAMVFEVFSRYVLAAPTAWAFEISYMLMGTIFMLGIAFALKERQHVNVDLFTGIFPPRVNAAISLLGYALLLPCVAWLTYALSQYAIAAYRSGEVTGKSAWNPVVWPFRVVLAVGFAVFALQIVVEVVRTGRVLFGAPRVGGDAA